MSSNGRLQSMILYRDRLTHQAEVWGQEIATATLRLHWLDFEQEARTALGRDDQMRLESVGLLQSDDIDSNHHLALIDRRNAQLASLNALLELVDDAIRGLQQ